MSPSRAADSACRAATDIGEAPASTARSNQVAGQLGRLGHEGVARGGVGGGGGRPLGTGGGEVLGGLHGRGAPGDEGLGQAGVETPAVGLGGEGGDGGRHERDHLLAVARQEPGGAQLGDGLAELGVRQAGDLPQQLVVEVGAGAQGREGGPSGRRELVDLGAEVLDEGRVEDKLLAGPGADAGPGDAGSARPVAAVPAGRGAGAPAGRRGRRRGGEAAAREDARRGPAAGQAFDERWDAGGDLGEGLDHLLVDGGAEDEGGTLGDTGLVEWPDDRHGLAAGQRGVEGGERGVAGGGPVGDDDGHVAFGRPLDHADEDAQRRRVEPVGVVDEQRLGPGGEPVEDLVADLALGGGIGRGRVCPGAGGDVDEVGQGAERVVLLEAPAGGAGEPEAVFGQERAGGLQDGGRVRAPGTDDAEDGRPVVRQRQGGDLRPREGRLSAIVGGSYAARLVGGVGPRTRCRPWWASCGSRRRRRWTGSRSCSVSWMRRSGTPGRRPAGGGDRPGEVTVDARANPEATSGALPPDRSAPCSSTRSARGSLAPRRAPSAASAGRWRWTLTPMSTPHSRPVGRAAVEAPVGSAAPAGGVPAGSRAVGLH